MVQPRGTILMRRAAAIAVVVAISAGIWLLVRGGEKDGGQATARDPAPATRGQALAQQLDTGEQTDQVLLLGFEGVDATAPIVAELRDRQLGGVLVDRPNWLDAATGAVLISELGAAGRSGGRIPPLVVGTQEGGAYRSYADLPPAERALEIGDAGSSERARAWARQTAGALRDVGFHVNLFPVADVATLDSPVADRAFSDDAGTTAVLTVAAIAGCRDAELACAPLHFPGLGAASQDTAQGPATVGLDAGTLSARDVEPFRAAIAAGAPAIVLSLALYSAYDPVTPGALEPAVATGLLRDELGFEGVAITDDLSSGAVKATHRVPDAAVAALAAGADLVQISKPEDQERVHQAIVAAVESGELPPERLGEAAGRVLELKRRLGLLGAPE